MVHTRKNDIGWGCATKQGWCERERKRERGKKRRPDEIMLMLICFGTVICDWKDQ